MSALVLDAHLKSALASIRSLGAKGIPVVAGAERSTAMGLHSRHTSRSFIYPSPLKDRAGFVEAVRRVAAESQEPPVLYAFSDATFLPLFEQRSLLNDFLLAVFPASSLAVTTAFSKAETLKLAARLGVETPTTCFFADSSDLERHLHGFTYPVVLKPRHSASWCGNSGVSSGVSFLFSEREVPTAFRSIARETGEFPLLQEFIQGEELGVEFLCGDGEALAVCAHRRIRSLSPAGGAAVVKETVSEDYLHIGELGRRVVAALRWSGPVMVEFKVDSRDGRPRLMEVNGRFWGSLPLAVFAGVDFPYLYYQMAKGQTIQPAGRYAEGLRSRHWLGDAGNLLSVMFRRDPLRRLTYPGRVRACLDFLRVVPGSRSDVAALGDPAPAVMEIVDNVWRRLR